MGTTVIKTDSKNDTNKSLDDIACEMAAFMGVSPCYVKETINNMISLKQSKNGISRLMEKHSTF